MERDDIQLEDVKNYAWGYFKIHAQQRLTTFNFYITLATLIGTGLFVSLADDYKNNLISALLSINLILFSFVFWKLDVRNRQLINNAEEALKVIEGVYLELDPRFIGINLFKNDDVCANNNKPNNIFYRANYSYSDCFNFLYVMFAVTGALGLVISMCKMGLLYA